MVCNQINIFALESSGGKEEPIECFMNSKGDITFQCEGEENHGNFSFTITPEDWERIKSFVDGELSAD